MAHPRKSSFIRPATHFEIMRRLNRIPGTHRSSPILLLNTYELNFTPDTTERLIAFADSVQNRVDRPSEKLVLDLAATDKYSIIGRIDHQLLKLMPSFNNASETTGIYAYYQVGLKPDGEPSVCETPEMEFYLTSRTFLDDLPVLHSLLTDHGIFGLPYAAPEND